MASILNSSIKPLGANGHFSGTYEKLGTNIESISVVIKSNVDGEVKVIFADSPSLPAIFTHTYSYDHTQEFHRVVSKKGLYIKVQYTNGAEAQTSFQLKTYFKNDFEVEQTTEGGNDVNVTNEFLSTEVINNITVEGLTFTESGALIVSGGGSGGGDASSVNQLTQIEKAEATNDKLDILNNNITKCNTDSVIIDSSDPVQTVLLAKVENTDNNSFLTLNSSQHLNVNITNDKLQVYEEPLIITEPAYLDFNNDSGNVIGDSPTGCWYNPLDDIEGWEYKNITVGGAQVYYYTNTSLVPGASEQNITLGSVSSGWCVASLDIITTTNNTWIMGIYTKPTGSGDAQIWYKSRRSYQVSSSFPLSKGVDYLFYWGTNPTTVHPELQHVEMALASTQGPADPSEIVQFMSVNIPSNAPQYEFQGRIKKAGYIRSGICREVHFLNSNKVQAELKINQFKFNTLVPDVGEGALFVNVENDIGVTGSVSLTEGSVVGITGPVSLAEGSVVGLTGPIGLTGPVSLAEGSVVGITGPVSLAEGSVVGLTGPIGLTGPVSLAEGSVVGITGPVGITGNVQVDNMINISTLATQETLNYIKTQTDKFTYISKDGDNALLVQVNNQLTTPFNISGDVKIQSSSGDFITSKSVDGPATALCTSIYGYDLANDQWRSIRISETNGLYVESNPGTTMSISGAVEISNEPTVNLASGSQIGINNFPSVQSVSIDGTPTVSLAYGSAVQASNIPGGHLDCYIVNQDQGSTINVNVNNTPSVSVSSGSISIDNQPTVSLAYGSIVQASNIPGGHLDCYIVNQDQGSTINVNVNNTPSVSVTGTVDTHMYANGSGGSMHLVSCDSQGKLNICLHDNSGTGITSTTDGTKQALDVKLSSNPTLSASTSDILVFGYDSTSSVNRKLELNSSGAISAVCSTNGTALEIKSVKYGSWGNVYNNQASILPSAVSSSLDVSNWSYFMGWYQDSTTGSGTGSIYLEYSFDNVTFYRIFNTMIVPSGSGTRTANITKQDLGGIKYIRMNNATTQTLTSVTLTLFGASN